MSAHAQPTSHRQYPPTSAIPTQNILAEDADRTGGGGGGGGGGGALRLSGGGPANEDEHSALSLENEALVQVWDEGLEDRLAREYSHALQKGRVVDLVSESEEEEDAEVVATVPAGNSSR